MGMRTLKGYLKSYSGYLQLLKVRQAQWQFFQNLTCKQNMMPTVGYTCAKILRK